MKKIEERSAVSTMVLTAMMMCMVVVMTMILAAAWFAYYYIAFLAKQGSKLFLHLFYLLRFRGHILFFHLHTPLIQICEILTNRLQTFVQNGLRVWVCGIHIQYLYINLARRFVAVNCCDHPVFYDNDDFSHDHAPFLSSYARKGTAAYGVYHRSHSSMFIVLP